MIENLHPAIKNPEVYPGILLKEVNKLVHLFAGSYSEDIKKGCKRNFCVLPAMKLTNYLKSKGFPKAKIIKGTFTVDDPRPLSVSDFTDEERVLAKKQGFYLADQESAWKFVEQNNLINELKNIPHYWTQIDKLIIDFTGEEQFVKSGMANDNNIQRYKKRLKEDKNKTGKDILLELGNSKYPWHWFGGNSEIQIAQFKTETGDEIEVSFSAIEQDENGTKEIDNSIGVAFDRNGRSDETGEGDAFKIFSTVLAIIYEYMKVNTPNKIFGAAYKPPLSGLADNDVKDDNKQRTKKRADIYRKVFEVIAKKMGYTLTTKDVGYQEYFILNKKGVITETGDSIYPYKWKLKSSEKGQYVAHFKSADGGLITFDVGIYDEKSDTWLVEFRKWQSYKATGDGDAFKIFSTVNKLIEEFVHLQKPKILLIESEKIKSGGHRVEGSRSKLYRVLVKKLASKIDYSLTVSDRFDFTSFLLQRKDKLTELGETSYPFKVTYNELELFSAEFFTNKDVKVEFFSKLMSDETTWDTAFSANGSIGITGGGDQYRILSTILKLMNLFILTKNPKIITFSSDKIRDISSGKRKTSRTNIYKKAMDIISNKHGYKVKIIQLPYMDKFVLTKEQPLTEEINSKELTTSLYSKIMSYSERINKADTPAKILSVIKQISRKQALEMSKNHISDIDYSSWIFEFKLTQNSNHQGAVAFNEHGFGLLQIYLSNPLIEQYLKDMQIPEKRDEVFTTFWYDLTRLISHEMLHLEQWLRSKGKQANRKTMLGKLKSERGSVKTDTPENFKHYLSDKLEISAYALNAVQELIHNNIDIHRLYKEYIIKNNSDIRDYIRSKSPSYNSYYVYFGQNKNDRKDQQVWNLFLKKFTYHLELRVKA